MNKVTDFVEAADRLVNTLATKPQDDPAAVRAHRKRLDEDYARYDVTRTALMGDPASEE